MKDINNDSQKLVTKKQCLVSYWQFISMEKVLGRIGQMPLTGALSRLYARLMESQYP